MSRIDTQRVKRMVDRSQHRERSIGVDPLQELERDMVFSGLERNRHVHLPEPLRVYGEHKTPCYASPSPGEDISAAAPLRSNQRHLVGATLVLAMAAVLASGCAGGDGSAPKPSQNVPQAVQEAGDTVREINVGGRASERKSDYIQIRNLRNSGLLKPGEKALQFGDVWIAPREEPDWHDKLRKNTISEMTSGKTLYSERDIQRAMIEDAIAEAKGETPRDRRPEVGLENINMLEKNLGTKLFNEIFDKVGQTQRQK